ncbi:hypothetical protein HQ560_21035, partial [bacterium]|nr:hypothetical protein [bacterium]
RPKAVQKYLIEQLQVAGGREVVEALGKALLDTELCDPAARALVAIGHGAAEPFLAALPKVVGRSRLSVLKKLGALRCQKAEGAFTQALGDEDADIRIAGAWALARIGAGADTLIERADAGKGWERINLTDACMTLAETLAAAGKEKEAAAIYVHLQKTRTDDSEKHILDAATRALRAIEKGN